MIADFKNKVRIVRPGAPTQTAGGGLTAAKPDCCDEGELKYAMIEQRSGSMQVDSAQREWSYDYKITTRYSKSFVEQGGDLVKHEGKTLVVRSVSFDGEGAKRLVILRCSVNE
jgi:hypothetical protein